MASDSDPPSKRRKKSDGDEVSQKNDNEPSAAPLVVFAHGAGAPSTSEWMIRWKEMLKEALGAVEVNTFDYPYISGGKRKAPPKAEKLVDHHLDVVRNAIAKHPGHPLVLAGKSMGSRVSCMVANTEEIHVSAVICLGYPLKGTNGAVRDELLVQLKVPTMFVQGSKDSLCPLEKLETTRKKMKCINELHVIDGGDHSFKIGKKFLESTGSNQDEAERKAVEAISEFVSRSTMT
ncbi:uncharacterized protein A4U43_C01F26300 [Asparagus officinalis]|uniref:KANL3/Tex30 alpha/beta hydrolase-like domain-containing protein n=1 Tax=Asparagus officinalis TaxID=4686 RepID=A0A5P1FWC3_ASPOF|nr:KAT8 regulatory NSL complex subunit 3 [Asparagus officinalis]ONK81191.1 uncharacterized protein A4U43_C01F26300 [Asparagus officinalis]